MRIIHVLNHTFIHNGHVHVAIDLACVQAQMGHDVAIISGGGNFDGLLAQHSVRHIVIDQRRQPLNLIKAGLAFGRAFAEFKPDIVHAHMMTSAGLAWPWRKLRGFRLITTVHNEFERSAVIMGLGDRVIAVSDAVRASMQARGIRGGPRFAPKPIRIQIEDRAGSGFPCSIALRICAEHFIQNAVVPVQHHAVFQSISKTG
jgi:hypothetical protein